MEIEKKQKLPRAYSMRDLNAIKHIVFNFKGEWKALFGNPEMGATWFVFGNSGNGKSTACAMLAAMFTQHAKVLYVALEEKKGKSIQVKLSNAGLGNENKNFLLLPQSNYTQLIERLHKRHSAEVVFIDSLQYWGITYRQYQQLTEVFPSKTFIFISHAKGKEPKGGTADSIHYDAAVKIWVEGGVMSVKHRFEGGGGRMTVIEDLAIKYWGENI